MTANELHAKFLENSKNDMLDDLIDGKPMMIVDSPQLRRAIRKRRMERSLESRADFAEVLANYQRLR